MLTSTDMCLRPDLESQKSEVEQKMEPFKRMTTSLGSRKHRDDFVKLMEGELWTIVRSQDCEEGIRLLTDTLKKFHVNNFAIQQ